MAAWGGALTLGIGPGRGPFLSIATPVTPPHVRPQSRCSAAIRSGPEAHNILPADKPQSCEKWNLTCVGEGGRPLATVHTVPAMEELLLVSGNKAPQARCQSRNASCETGNTLGRGSDTRNAETAGLQLRSRPFESSCCVEAAVEAYVMTISKGAIFKMPRSWLLNNGQTPRVASMVNARHSAGCIDTRWRRPSCRTSQAETQYKMGKLRPP